jgi:putative redox protein
MQHDISPNYTIEYSEPLRTHSTHLSSGTTIITDAPTDNHGKGEAFSPTDLLSSSLVSCAMTIMGITAQSCVCEIVSIKADVAKEMTTSPRRIAKVTAYIDVILRGATQEDAERLERSARSCPVAKSLSPDLNQDLHFNFKLLNND